MHKHIHTHSPVFEGVEHKRVFHFLLLPQIRVQGSDYRVLWRHQVLLLVWGDGVCGCVCVGMCVCECVWYV
jgi:hypothetical protein